MLGSAWAGNGRTAIVILRRNKIKIASSEGFTFISWSPSVWDVTPTMGFYVRRQQGQRMTVQVHIASSRHRYLFPLPKALILSSRAERMEKLYTLGNVRRAAEGPRGRVLAMLAQGVFVMRCPGNSISRPQVSAKSCQRGFTFSMSAIFLSSRHRLICFSRAMAFLTSSNAS